MLADLTKGKRKSSGCRQGLVISNISSLIEPEIKTQCLIFNDDLKDPVTYTYYYSDGWRVRRRSKTEFENNKYENTGLTLKEIMDTAIKLIDRDQVAVDDITVTAIDRNIACEIYNNGKYLTIYCN